MYLRRSYSIKNTFSLEMTNLEQIFRKRFIDIANLEVFDDELYDLPEKKTLNYYRYGHEIESKYLASEDGIYFRWSIKDGPSYKIPKEAKKFYFGIVDDPMALVVSPDGIESSRYKNIVVDPQYWLPLNQVIFPNHTDPECRYTIFVQVRKNSPFYGHISYYAELEEGSYSMTLRHISEYQDMEDILEDLRATLKFQDNSEDDSEDDSDRVHKIRQILDGVYSKATNTPSK